MSTNEPHGLFSVGWHLFAVRLGRNGPGSDRLAEEEGNVILMSRSLTTAHIRALALCGLTIFGCDATAKANHDAEVAALKGRIAQLEQKLAEAQKPAVTEAVTAAAATPKKPLEQPPAAPAKEPMAIKVGALVFGQPTVREQMGLTTVLSEVTNTMKKPVTCTVSTTFKKGGAILLKADGVLMDLPAGETRPSRCSRPDQRRMPTS